MLLPPISRRVFSRSTSNLYPSIVSETRDEYLFRTGTTHVALNPDGLPVGFRFKAGEIPVGSRCTHVDVVTPRGVFEVSRERGLRLINACKAIN